jgi:predicted ATP-grasp superfamily ATP-dependent carboligase
MSTRVSDLPAVILGGRETAVPVCRSLGRAGVPVIALGEAEDPIRDSRYCTRFVEVQDGDGLERRWLEVLRSEPIQGALIPVSDHGAELVSHNREELVRRGYVPFEANDDAVLAMLDKGRSYEIAARAGVPIPATVVLRDADDLRATADFAFPCGIKPLEGHLFRERTGIQDKVVVVDSHDELVARAEPWLRAGDELMITELVGGPDDQIYALFTYLDERGKPLFTFTNRKLRQDPPHFGVGSYVCHEERPEVVDLGLRFLSAAGMRGLAHVEFKRDPRDGRFKLIECNPRFNLSIGLLTACGLDLPLFTYRRLVGEPVPPLEIERPGLHLWHPVPDLRAARQLREEGDLTWPAWLRSLLHRQRFTLLARDDPRPSLVANARTVRGWVSRRARRRRRASKP